MDINNNQNSMFGKVIKLRWPFSELEDGSIRRDRCYVNIRNDAIYVHVKILSLLITKTEFGSDALSALTD